LKVWKNFSQKTVWNWADGKKSGIGKCVSADRDETVNVGFNELQFASQHLHELFRPIFRLD